MTGEIDQFDEEMPKKGQTAKKRAFFLILIFVLMLIAAVLMLIPVYDVSFKDASTINQSTPYQQALGENIKTPLKRDGNSNLNSASQNRQTPTINVAVRDKMVQQLGDIDKQNTAIIQSQQTVQESLEVTQQSLGQLRSSLSKHQNTAQEVIASATIKLQGSLNQIMTKVNALNEHEEKVEEELIIFDLVAVNLWDSKPQATIRYQGKMSIVEIGYMRLDWKVADIDFDKEQMTVVKNGQTLTLGKIK